MSTYEQTPEQAAYLEKLRSIGVNTRGKDTKVREYRSPESGIVRKSLDEHGNVVTEHSKTDRQDVHIQAQPVTAAAAQPL